MEDIRANLKKINDQIKTAAESCGRSADDVLLVAVSKTRTPEEIKYGYRRRRYGYRRKQGPGDNGQV